MDTCCKYCLEDSKENDQSLIYPCQCTTGVHPDCLTIWLLVCPVNNDKRRCEICRTNYIGIIIPPIPAVIQPPPPMIQPPSSSDEEEEYTIDIVRPPANNRESCIFICCKCEWFEATSYIVGTIFGLSSSIISILPEYYHRSMQFIFTTFLGFFIGLYLIGLISTGIRYYKKCINGRRVYDTNH